MGGLAADCVDALACEHEPAMVPPGVYAAKSELDVAEIRRQFPDYPRYHLNAIWRGRSEHPGRAKRLRDEMSRALRFRRGR